MVYVVTVYVVGEQWGTKVLSMLIKVVETVKVPKENTNIAWISVLVQVCVALCWNADNSIKRGLIKALSKKQA